MICQKVLWHGKDSGGIGRIQPADYAKDFDLGFLYHGWADFRLMRSTLLFPNTSRCGGGSGVNCLLYPMNNRLMSHCIYKSVPIVNFLKNGLQENTTVSQRPSQRHPVNVDIVQVRNTQAKRSALRQRQPTDR